MWNVFGHNGQAILGFAYIEHRDRLSHARN